MDRKHQTPTGKGELYAKAIGVTFEYGPHNPKELVGQLITHSNTFDKATLKRADVMPDDMKSIFMRVTSDVDSQFYTRTRQMKRRTGYTVGNLASSGCSRIDREDMCCAVQRSFEPSVYEGNLQTTVPITIYYECGRICP